MWPCKTIEGKIVNIVDKSHGANDTEQILTDEDGTEYIVRSASGESVLYPRYENGLQPEALVGTQETPVITELTAEQIAEMEAANAAANSVLDGKTEDPGEDVTLPDPEAPDEDAAFNAATSEALSGYDDETVEPVEDLTTPPDGDE